MSLKPGHQRRGALLIGVAVALTVALVSEIAQIVPAAADVGAPSAPGSVDYFTNRWNDPMDFNNGEDLDLTPGRMVQNGSANWDNGKLHLSNVGQVFFLRHDPGGLPNSAIRDPEARPLNANRFTRIAFSMYSNINSVTAIGYRTCGSCPDGFRYFDIVAGWHTYDIDMQGTNDHENFQNLGHSGHAGFNWESTISLLYMAPAFNGSQKPDLLLDWFSIYQPSASTASRPSPRVISPSEGGGTDFASAVRGDPWDMDQSSDVALTANARTSFGGGQLNAAGAGALNDPVVVLNIGAQAIDATLYKKFAVTISYDGPWGLADAPGGGLVSRIIWRTASGGVQQVALPMVMNTGKTTYIVDLSKNVIDPAGTPQVIPWGQGAGTFVSQLRFDPHEDPGGRSWYIDDVKLLRNEAVAPTFDIHYSDDNWASGTTADVYADTDDDTGNGLGTRIASGLGVAAGVNTYRWNGAGVGAGSYYIHTVLFRGPQSTIGTSTGQVDVGINGAGTPPATSAVSADQDQQLQRFIWFMAIIKAKFFCGVARANGVLWIGKSPTCNQLLGPMPVARKKKRRR